MNYRNGEEIQLGDVVEVSMPSGIEKATVVMLGSTYEHLPLEESFMVWVHKERILKSNSIVLEWIGRNPLAHNDPNFAPVGNYMFTGISDDLNLIKRKSK